MNRDKLTGHLSIAGTYTIFGLNLIFCKDIANAQLIPPIVLFTMRAMGASILFWLLSAFLPKEKVAREDYGKIFLASMAGLFIPQLTFLSAITMATPLDTGILGTLGPIFTMFFAFLFLGEPITLKKAGGVALSFAGVLFLVYNSVHTGGAASTKPLGVVLLLVNSISFSLYLGAFRPLISRYGVVTFMKWMFLFSLIVSIPFSASGLVHTDFAAIPSGILWEVGYLVFFATFIAYFLIPYGRLDRNGRHNVEESPGDPAHRRWRRACGTKPSCGQMRLITPSKTHPSCKGNTVSASRLARIRRR